MGTTGFYKKKALSLQWLKSSEISGDLWILRIYILRLRCGEEKKNENNHASINFPLIFSCFDFSFSPHSFVVPHML